MAPQELERAASEAEARALQREGELEQERESAAAQRFTRAQLEGQLEAKEAALAQLGTAKAAPSPATHAIFDS